MGELRYLFYFDTKYDGYGADIGISNRPITIDNPYHPEFLLSIHTTDRKSIVSSSFEFFAWDGSEWSAIKLIGGEAIQNGSLAIIMSIPVVVIFLILQQTLIKRMVLGSIDG